MVVMMRVIMVVMVLVLADWARKWREGYGVCTANGKRKGRLD